MSANLTGLVAGTEYMVSVSAEASSEADVKTELGFTSTIIVPLKPSGQCQLISARQLDCRIYTHCHTSDSLLPSHQAAPVASGQHTQTHTHSVTHSSTKLLTHSDSQSRP
ncbi:unnamed protein product [Protopolystoma xenopodis]|uniref:Uncharacterized protein n=1 Tax=Protopolystoma xenopodis TaxID=117903 RepID=A0A448WRD0_9PLAT|nr:unnamed protein product [Protopolystoma xenopodis]